ncbi:hypothetical protein ACS0TY_024043 [Phlomoides rotata]
MVCTSGLQIYYLSSSSLDGTDAVCESLGCKRLPGYDPALRAWKYLDALAEEGSVHVEDFPFEELGDEDYCASLPFAALFSCFKAKGLKVTCLFCYCSEGDNIPEAFGMAEATCKFMGLNKNEVQGNGAANWITPFSWQSVYGPPADIKENNATNVGDDRKPGEKPDLANDDLGQRQKNPHRQVVFVI